MATKSGELREMLMSCIEDAKAGKLGAAEATAISKLAAQVSQSLAVELKAREEDEKLKREALGSMSLGDES